MNYLSTMYIGYILDSLQLYHYFTIAKEICVIFCLEGYSVIDNIQLFFSFVRNTSITELHF